MTTYIKWIIIIGLFSVFIMYMNKLEEKMFKTGSKRYIYLIPKGYKGKVEVTFGKDKINEDFETIKFDKNGKASIKSKIKNYKTYSEYYIYEGENKEELSYDHIGGGYTEEENGTIKYIFSII